MPSRSTPSSSITAATLHVPSHGVTPGRAPKLAEASFIGRFAAKLDEYESLPSLDSKSLFMTVLEEEVEDIGDAVEDKSVLNVFDNDDHETPNLAALAERTRSQLLERRSKISFADGVDDDSSVIEDGSTAAEAVHGSGPDTASEAPTRARHPTRTKLPPQASMMTHAPSRITHATTGKPLVGGGHTFGSLPRASPSGTMAHHVPKAAGAEAGVSAAVVVRRPSSARGRLQADKAAPTDGSGGLGVVEERAAALARFYKQPPPKRPQSARERPQTADAATAGQPTSFSSPAPKPFGADAKGGALAWGRPPTKPRVPLASRTEQTAQRASGTAVRSRQELKKQPAQPSTASAAPFAFVHDIQECCGDEYDGYCCKRHHPDDAIICCAKHAPAIARSQAGSEGMCSLCTPAKSLQGSSVVVAKRASGAGGNAMRKRYEKLVLSSDSHLGVY